MDTCGATRLLVPGFLVGLAVTTVAGNDLLGWIAAAATVGVLMIVQRVRGTGSACAIRLPEEPSQDSVSPSAGSSNAGSSNDASSSGPANTTAATTTSTT